MLTSWGLGVGVNFLNNEASFNRRFYVWFTPCTAVNKTPSVRLQSLCDEMRSNNMVLQRIGFLYRLYSKS